MEDELYLWQRFLSGDNRAFVRLYDKYVPKLFVYGQRYITDKESVKDLIQDTLIKIYNDRDKLTHIKSIQSYFFTSFKNNLIDFQRKEQIHLRYIQSLELSDFDEDTIEMQLISREQESENQHKIDKIMSSLSSRQKKVIYYHYIENKSIKDISIIMSMNYQSVQNIIQRSIKKARGIFSKKK